MRIAIIGAGNMGATQAGQLARKKERYMGTITTQDGTGPATPAWAAFTPSCRGGRCLVPCASQRVSGRPAGSASWRSSWHAT
jgi:hypothetical protein